VKPNWFFAYERYYNMVVSDKEKTIIDCLHVPAYAGGISHIYQALTSDLNIDTLIAYCQQTKSSTIASRLGYLLDKKQLREIHTAQLPLHVFEQDYIQALFLHTLFQTSDVFVFKGGTFLKHAYGLDRFS